jgi:hypothetical protein
MDDDEKLRKKGLSWSWNQAAAIRGGARGEITRAKGVYCVQCAVIPYELEDGEGMRGRGNEFVRR